jgi:S1-C subfamily serine protease
MSADINHGDSGGPVLDSRGRVIAINVGSATGASGHTLAVPINYAREMLRDLHVQVDSGPATALWIEALADYNEQHYADANTKLNLLREIQAQVRDTNGRSMPLQSTLVIYSEKVNPYIDEMINRVLEKLHPTRTAMN